MKLTNYNNIIFFTLVGVLCLCFTDWSGAAKVPPPAKPPIVKPIKPVIKSTNNVPKIQSAVRPAAKPQYQPKPKPIKRKFNKMSKAGFGTNKKAVIKRARARADALRLNLRKNPATIKYVKFAKVTYTKPRSKADKIALKKVMAYKQPKKWKNANGSNRRIIGKEKIGDKRYAGYEKWRYAIKGTRNKAPVVIHYFFKPGSGVKAPKFIQPKLTSIWKRVSAFKKSAVR